MTLTQNTDCGMSSQLVTALGTQKGSKDAELNAWDTYGYTSDCTTRLLANITSIGGQKYIPHDVWIGVQVL